MERSNIIKSKVMKILDIVSDEDEHSAATILAGAMVESYDKLKNKTYSNSFKDILTREVRESILHGGIKCRSTTIEGFANELEVAAGTTGLVDGDRSFAFFGIKETLCHGTTTIKVDDECLDFSVEIGGDSEIQTMIEALKFIVQTLEQGIAGKG